MAKKLSKLQKVLKGVKLKSWKLEPEILLSSNIPMPMHGVAPRLVLGSKWWNKTRNDSYKSTGYHCVACGVHKSQAFYRKWLEGHELYKVDYEKGTMKYLRTVPLCHMCHNYIHDGRLLSLLEKGKINHQKYAAIIQHGDRVLVRAGLNRKNHEARNEEIIELIVAGKVKEWSKWRLVIGRKRYPPKFKSESHLRKAFK